MRFGYYCITALGFLYLVSCQSGGNGSSSDNGSSSTNATTTNSTIYEVLNSTESSPVQWISQFLQSSPNYESLINLLNQSETNITVFIPSDQVYQAISSFMNSTNNTTNGGGTTNGGTNNGNSSNGGTSTNGSENNGASFNMSQYFTSPYIMNFNMTDVIYYHIVNESILIQDLFSNDTMGNATVVNSLVSNDTINRLGYGVQLLLQKIQANQTNSTETSGNQTNGTETSGNQTNSTETSGDQSSTLVTDGSSNNNTGFNYTIGNGFGYATINTTQIVQTSNGIIYIIDKVLVPPVDFNLTLEALPNITQFSNLTTEQFNITQFEQLFTTLNATNSSAFETLANMTNVTYFVPVDNAFAMTGESQVDNQTLPNLLAAHIVQGVYYTTNITNATEDITAQSLAGQNITLSKNDTSFFVNNATIVVPDILLDSGVVHLIDTVLNYTSGAGNNTTGSSNGTAVPPPPPGGSGTLSSIATSNTMSGATSNPTSTASGATGSGTGNASPTPTTSGATGGGTGNASPTPTTSGATGGGTGNAFPTPTTGSSSDASMNAPAMYLAAVFAIVAYVF
ncbi:hypothetical protein G6F70_001951 [Rhizopus microsporus]|uniref:FAS1 domain-containing protein n=1 Tax=Rhizopus azygosporus TaxID=86630 RepID=A0A367J8W1_RHIAZ|nr:hypothetical protein G6F71_002097 [Rhizopus microsporus]RCH86181.1 hypothetical protein CU097_008143 [Rhizopus azygosporus]KAG1202808.1 hypothetical protein G6F70_001951 [Rhizopus microsporus]KAG1214441.1 hypothetical protein G6F69_001938 [Rhizopus microsporus]KAG1237118.1 hypothetical protein G6F67_001471 [Rhizopus microsporus]